jgi:hypothetical protein
MRVGAHAHKGFEWQVMCQQRVSVVMEREDRQRRHGQLLFGNKISSRISTIRPPDVFRSLAMVFASHRAQRFMVLVGDAEN